MLRTSRGTQSIVRNSSSMAPRIRGTQYVSNFTPRDEVEGVDRVHQAEHAGRDQVVEFDAFGQPGPDSLAVVFDQRQVHLDQPVAHVLVVGIGLEGLPDLRHFLSSDGHYHPILHDQRGDAL